MYEIMFQTLVRMCEKFDTPGVRLADLKAELRADGITMNDVAFGAILFEWDRFERYNGKRVTFHNSTSSRGKTYGYNLGIDLPGPNFQAGAVSLKK
jgi:hypothetical protein